MLRIFALLFVFVGMTACTVSEPEVAQDMATLSATRVTATPTPTSFHDAAATLSATRMIATPTQATPTPTMTPLPVINFQEESQFISTSTPTPTPIPPTATPIPPTPLPLQPIMLPPPVVDAENIFFAGYISTMYIHDFAVQNGYVYIVAGRELIVWDFRNPANPQRVASAHLANSLPDAVTIVGNYAYVAHYAQDKVSVINIATPTTPLLVNQLTGLRFTALVQGEDNTYIVDEEERWWQLAGTELPLLLAEAPPLPVVDDSHKTVNEVIDWYWVDKSIQEDDIVYLTKTDPNIHSLSVFAYDISTPTNPRLLGQSQNVIGHFMAQTNDTMFFGFFGETGSSLYMVDVQDPTMPVILGQPNIGTDVIYPVGDLIYTGAYPGVVMMDISNPPVFPRIASIDIQRIPSYGLKLALDEMRQQLYVVNGSYGEGYGLHIVDVEDPFAPTLLGNYLPKLGESLGGAIYNIAVQGDYVFLRQRDGMGVVSVVDPNNLQPVAFWPHEGNFLLHAATNAVGAPTIYYTPITEDGFQILDITEPLNPVEVADITLPKCGTFEQIVMHGGYAYALSGGCGLVAVDTLEPPTMEPMATKPCGANKALAINGRYAYWLSNQCGLVIMDITNPIQPVPVGHYDIQGDEIILGNNLIYVEDREGLTALTFAQP